MPDPVKTDLQFATTEELVHELRDRSFCLVVLLVPKLRDGDSYNFWKFGRTTEARGLLDYAYLKTCDAMDADSAGKLDPRD